MFCKSVSEPVSQDLAEAGRTGRGIQSTGRPSEKAAAGTAPPRTWSCENGERKDLQRYHRANILA
ncbi:MAG: hypothetical protein HY466_02930 [Deltaproteobacteria bacterium]|nr:hypothetical protein [Deltaproteobacteria bacterium]